MNLPDDVVAFLKEKHQPDVPLADDDLTAARAGEIWGVAPITARGRLEKLVQRGEMTRIQKIDTGTPNKSKVWVYRPKE